jgi:hypothetical protein
VGVLRTPTTPTIYLIFPLKTVESKKVKDSS